MARRTATLALAASLMHAAGALVASRGGGARLGGWTRARPTMSTAYSIDDMPIPGPVTPVRNQVLVKLVESTLTTIGGLIMPDDSAKKPCEGTIISAGPGNLHPDTGYLTPMPLSVGESVLFGEFDGYPVDYCGESHVLVKDDDVLFAWSGAKTVEAVRPVSDRLLVRVTKKAEERESGIVLSADAAETQKVSEGVVLRAGEGRKAVSDGTVTPMPVAVGEYVKYRDYAGVQVVINAEKLVVCRAADCLSKWAADDEPTAE